MESVAPENKPKKRHGCLTVWLILMIVVYMAAMLLSLIVSLWISNPSEEVSKLIFIMLAVIASANVIFAVFILKWKKWAFWAFVVTSFITMGINIYAGNGILSSTVGLFGVGILYAVMQIKEGDVSGWENLD